MYASGSPFSAASNEQTFAPRIYYFDPSLAGSAQLWPEYLDRCSDLGFDCLLSAPLFVPGSAGDLLLTSDHEQAHPGVAADTPADTLIEQLAGACQARGLQLYLDIVIGRVAADARVARSNPQWFEAANRGFDPRSHRSTQAAYARVNDAAVGDAWAEWWSKRLRRLIEAGAVGFRCEDAGDVPAPFWERVIGAARRHLPDCRFLAWTPGVPWSVVQTLRDVGFAGAFSSLPWWDGRSRWLVEEHRLLRDFGAVIGTAEAPFRYRQAGGLSDERAQQIGIRHVLQRAAAIGSGLMVPMGFELSLRDENARLRVGADELRAVWKNKPFLADEIRKANALSAQVAALAGKGEMRMLGDAASPVTALLRADSEDVRTADSGLIILINTDLEHEQHASIELDPLPPAAGMAATTFDLVPDAHHKTSPLAAGEVRLLKIIPTSPITTDESEGNISRFASAPRIAIDNVSPAVDAGRFAAKRIVGTRIAIEADVFTDGHDRLAVEALWRPVGERNWRRIVMKDVGNDRWSATVVPDRIGRYEFTIEAWRDNYGTFVRDLKAKYDAQADIRVEIAEGRQLLERVRQITKGSDAKLITSTLRWLADSSVEESVSIFCTPDLSEVMYEHEERPFIYRCSPPFALEVERPQAEFASWYELFPRSATESAERHGTFNDLVGRLPAIKDMGFDVLYLTPIHPIGRVNRKGKNNSLKVSADDVGSPYAIGSAEGGHDTIHPALGSLEDFRNLRDAAHRCGLEIALDFAVQCSPDHPWLKDHPEWFSWRPDGSLRYAENPPKKYQDIVNVDFYAPQAVPALWFALRDIVLHWADEGIRIFRVDNPHTKPLPFWEWLIGEVRGKQPDIIFLSEAFTRPKMMYRLAKVGFSQSYSYFTWRNSKQELTEYFNELTNSEVAEYFRPHLFVNTPDINPFFLQTSGRAGFLIRAALAATLSGLWGMYSGFEICEATPLPGREEYLDSEKYEIRARRYDTPGNIVAEITKLNRIRRGHPALQSHLGLRFYTAHDDQVLLYGKMSPSRAEMILVAVNLDPFHAHDVTIEVPLWEWKLSDDARIAVEDLMRETAFEWRGKLQRVRLDPAALPFAIWRIRPASD